MSCNTCHAKFSFFRKEHACPTCGFSHCSKCLKYQNNASSKGVKKICGRCYNKNTSVNKVINKMESPPSDSSDGPLAPVDITRKLDSLENPAKPPIVMYTHTNHWDKFKTGMAPVDQEIIDRLRKLKGEDKNVPLPSVEEIKRRLAILKDENPEEKRINIHQVDSRTDQEKTDDLIREYLERLQLSSRSDPDKEIEARLRALQDINNSRSNSTQSHSYNDFDDEDEHAITKKLIKKAIAEAALENKCNDVDELEDIEVENSTQSHNSNDFDDEDEGALEQKSSDVDELEDTDDETGTSNEPEEVKPSCKVCNYTTDLVRCIGCYNNIYCKVCYKNNHEKPFRGLNYLENPDDCEMEEHIAYPIMHSGSTSQN